MNIPAKYLGTIESSCTLPLLDEKTIRESLANPVWPGSNGPTVFDAILPGEDACFIVSDYTRKAATDLILPVIIKGLIEKGCSADDFSVLVASGIHRHPTREEINHILGDDASKLLGDRVHLHDPDDEDGLISIGTTSRGSDVKVNRRVMNASRLILLGAVTYHYHAGFGGGRKSLVPGVASRETIANSHSLTLDPDADRIHPKARIGIMDANPVSEEMLEGARMCNPTMIVNTVLSPEGKLIGLFSGELDLAHRQACELVKQTCGVTITEPADFIIASAEGAPNWIQSHKALYNASLAVKDNGTIILKAPCPEGIGDERFRYWVKKDTKDIFSELRKSPEVLGQTALSTITRGKNTVLITDMNEQDICDLGITTASDEASAIQIAMDKSGSGNETTYYLMPEARYVVPFLR